MSEANEFPVSSRIICLHTRKTNYNEFVLWQLLVLSLLMKYVYCRYESNFPLGPELSSQTGISLSQCNYMYKHMCGSHTDVQK